MIGFVESPLNRENIGRGHVFFITIATYEKYPWFGIHTGLADEAVMLLRDASSERETALFAWSVRADHIHVLLQGDNVIDFVRLYKGRMTPKASIHEKARKLWQRSFYDHAVRREESLSDIAAYIWENPVRAGIVISPADYPWSGSEAWPDWQAHYGKKWG